MDIGETLLLLISQSLSPQAKISENILPRIHKKEMCVIAWFLPLLLPYISWIYNRSFPAYGKFFPFLLYLISYYN
jgi:hypothetical protein